MRFLWMSLFFATLIPMRQSYVEGFRTLNKNSFGPKPKGTVKTIEALECGDIIDCVDIYKQPAFDNPTILKDFKYAIVEQQVNKGNGGKAKFNLWNPRVEGSTEFSLAQFWISAGDRRELNTIEAGWMVHPALYNDALTRLFIYWTADNYVETGCYNNMCSGFVELTNEMALGAALEPVSIINLNVSVLEFILTRTTYGDWYLQVGDEVLGFFPGSLFKHLDEGADEIQIGGEIVNKRERNRHTSTQMGSGRFSGEGLKKASFISNIEVMNENFNWVDPSHMQHKVTSPACYDLTLGPPRTYLKSHFFFGGPGFHSGCQ